MKIYQIIPFLLFLSLLTFSCNDDDTSGTSNEISKSILFTGNSYTTYNDMSNMVSKMASSVNDTLIYQQYALAGASVDQHANSTTLEGLISSHNWDFVTIQTQSQESALSQDYFDTNVYPFVTQLVEKIKNNASMPLFYMTWAYVDGDSFHCPDLPYMCTFEGMNDKIEERYTYFGSSTSSIVSPCGAVWREIRMQNPELNLYANDGSHPSRLGSYLAACSYYTMIFEKDPMLLTYDDPELDNTEEMIVKTAVKNIVYNTINNWKFN